MSTTIRWFRSTPPPCWKSSGIRSLQRQADARALEILRHEDSIDLLITDQAMPGMTGSELAATIRGEKPDLPVIIATGFAELAKEEGAEYPTLVQTIFPARSCRSDFGRWSQPEKSRSQQIVTATAKKENATLSYVQPLQHHDKSGRHPRCSSDQ